MALMTTVGMEFIARNRANGVIARFSQGLGGITRRLFSLRSAILGVAGVGGFGYLIKQQMAAIDSTAKLADRIKISTEALSGLQHGASIYGVQTETLNKSLEIFSRRMGEVQMGTGEAARALDQLGISEKALINLDMDQALMVIADQMQNLNSQSEKAAVANYLFGRSGQQLLNFFDQGSEGISRLRDEADRLGITFSRFDAQKVEEANDALNRMRAVFTGIGRTITIELAPYIEAAARAFTDWATSGEGLGIKISDAFEQAALSMADLAYELDRIINKMAQLTSPIDYARSLSKANEAAIARYRRQSGDVGAFVYDEGLLRPPRPPKDLELFKKIQAEEQQKQGLGAFDVDQQRKRIHDTFMSIKLGEDYSSFNYPEGLPVGQLDIAPDRLKVLEEMTAKSKELRQREAEANVEISEAEKTAIMEKAREVAEFVREQDYLTRQERILYLEEYVEQNAQALAQVSEAEKLLNDEITMYQRARLDQMRVFYAEMRERSQESYLVAMDFSASYARQVEYDFVHLWDPVIDGTKSAKEAMLDFFRQMLLNLAKAQAQMAMMMIWNKLFGPAVGGVSEALFGGFGGAVSGGLFHEGGMVGDAVASRQVPALAFAGARRYHQGLGADEFPAILERGEQVIPKGAAGRPTVVNNITIHAMDSQDVQRALYKERHFLGDMNIMNSRSNHPLRRADK